jgi:hypothetical protein
VNLWDIPESPSKNPNAPPPSAPRRLDINPDKRPDSDLTALHWNAEGTHATRFSAGFCELYFPHYQHQVMISMFQPLLAS